ncbi:hypothetical protein C8Q76DRAFT_228412 [Earliella scabrosa]|nr:hypothetical protein C8Q76DRAFT_228412 [Earliella scabrosa]
MTSRRSPCLFPSVLLVLAQGSSGLRRPHALVRSGYGRGDNRYSPLRSHIVRHPSPTGHSLAPTSLAHCPFNPPPTSNIQTAHTAEPLWVASVSSTTGRGRGENRTSRLRSVMKVTSRIVPHKRPLHDLATALPCRQSSARRVLPKVARVETRHWFGPGRRTFVSTLRSAVMRLDAFVVTIPTDVLHMTHAVSLVIIPRCSPCTNGRQG